MCQQRVGYARLPGRRRPSRHPLPTPRPAPPASGPPPQAGCPRCSSPGEGSSSSAVLPWLGGRRRRRNPAAPPPAALPSPCNPAHTTLPPRRMGTYDLASLPQFDEISAALRLAGDLARAYGQRLTFHPRCGGGAAAAVLAGGGCRCRAGERHSILRLCPHAPALHCFLCLAPPTCAATPQSLCQAGAPTPASTTLDLPKLLPLPPCSSRPAPQPLCEAGRPRRRAGRQVDARAGGALAGGGVGCRG